MAVAREGVARSGTSAKRAGHFDRRIHQSESARLERLDRPVLGAVHPGGQVVEPALARSLQEEIEHFKTQRFRRRMREKGSDASEMPGIEFCVPGVLVQGGEDGFVVLAQQPLTGTVVLDCLA
jgi:hypothetical protein